jgi:hypothetical protein
MINELKKYSIKFWIFFWFSSFVFLTGWSLFWSIKANGVASTLENIVSYLPIKETQKKDNQALVAIGDFFLKKDGGSRTVMVLFQNNLEIRPGGGFIGAFGIVKIKDGKILSLETHDLSNFDSRIPNTIAPPYPLAETGVAKFWKLRDSNFSPDFAVNAKKAQEFYRMGEGREQFDGVVAITSNVLTSILKITGPIAIEGYPGTYNSDNAVLSLEYQVEKAFQDQGIDQGQRKLVMSDLAKEIEKKVSAFSVFQKIELVKTLLINLDQKDIQLNFNDARLQKFSADAKWTGVVDENWNKDYLMTVDANMGSFKSDYYVKRSLDYAVDLGGENPVAHLKITYEHSAKQKDWMTRDYTDYLRVYVPEGAVLIDQQNFEDVKFGNEFGKQYFGAIINVPVGTVKTIEISYSLPKELKDNYALEIQKQAGLNDVPVTFHLMLPGGKLDGFSKLLNSDIVFK